MQITPEKLRFRIYKNYFFALRHWFESYPSDYKESIKRATQKDLQEIEETIKNGYDIGGIKKHLVQVTLIYISPKENKNYWGYYYKDNKGNIYTAVGT